MYFLWLIGLSAIALRIEYKSEFPHGYIKLGTTNVIYEIEFMYLWSRYIDILLKYTDECLWYPTCTYSIVDERYILTVPKLDKVREFLIRYEISLTFITETWLRGLVPDSIITIPAYFAFRRDVGKDNHGGVCAYVNHNISRCGQLSDLSCCDNHEVMWLRLRPRRLSRGFWTSTWRWWPIYPRPFISIAYLGWIKISYCGFLITGDFNRL